MTTYQTLNQDFNIPRDVDATEEAEWLADNGYDTHSNKRSCISSSSFLVGFLQGSNSFEQLPMKHSSFAIGESASLKGNLKSNDYYSAPPVQALALLTSKLNTVGCLRAHLSPTHCTPVYSSTTSLYSTPFVLAPISTVSSGSAGFVHGMTGMISTSMWCVSIIELLRCSCLRFLY